MFVEASNGCSLGIVKTFRRRGQQTIFAAQIVVDFQRFSERAESNALSNDTTIELFFNRGIDQSYLLLNQHAVN